MGFCKTRLLAAALASTLLAACGGEGSGPGDFDPVGMQADLALSEVPADDPVFSALSASFDDMATATGGSGAVVSAAGLFLSEPRSSQSTEQVSSVVRSLFHERSHPAINASIAIPPEVAGTTFEYDVDTDHWVPGDETGAPANGVRFILYAVDGGGAVIEPLDQIGYADLYDLTDGATAAGRIVVVANSTTWVDYRADLTGNEDAGELNVDGYIRFATDQWVFDFSMTYDEGETDDPAFTLASTVEFPQHDVEIEVNWNRAAGPGALLTFDERFQSPNGRLDYDGSWSDGTSPSLEIFVNGDAYAHLTGSGEDGLVGVDGRVLTDDEKEVLAGAFVVGQFAAITPVFLIGPMAGFVSPPFTF